MSVAHNNTSDQLPRMLSVGSVLRKERRRLGLSLEDVEKKTRIRKKYLEAIEDNDWSAFASKVYVTGLIKNYSKFFDLDEEKMAAYFRRDYERREEVKFKKRVEQKYFKSERKRIVIVLLMLIFLGFASYFGYQLSLYFKPPTIELLAPEERVFRSAERVTIQGKTENDATVRIFEDRVFQNEQGIFEYDFPLQEGKNTLIIQVTGANGRETRLEEVFILERQRR